MTAAPSFPSPSERPGAPVVIFDGQCRFCVGQVERLFKWDGGQRLAYLSLHDPLVQTLCPKLTHDDLMRQMYVVDASGRCYGGASALRFLTRRLPSLWWAVPFLHVPGTLPLLQWAYRAVASRRYQIAGKTDCDGGTCSLHFGKPNKS